MDSAENIQSCECTDQRDSVGESPIYQVSLELVAYILSFLNNADYGRCQRTSKFFHVISKADFLRRAEIDYNRCCGGKQALGMLHHASENGWIVVAEDILSKGPLQEFYTTEQGEIMTKGGRDCLATAYMNKQFKMVDWLIEHGYEPCFCCISVAIEHGDIPFYDRVCTLKTRFTNLHEFAIQHAIKAGRVYMLEYLMKKGLKPLIRGYTLTFQYACESGSLEMVNFIESYLKRTCMSCANEDYEVETQEYFQRKNRNRKYTNSRPHERIMDFAVQGGNPEIITKLIAQGFTLDPKLFERAVIHKKLKFMNWWYQNRDLYPVPSVLSVYTIRDMVVTRKDQKKAPIVDAWLIERNFMIEYYDNAIISAKDAIAKLREPHETTDNFNIVTP